MCVCVCVRECVREYVCAYVCVHNQQSKGCDLGETVISNVRLQSPAADGRRAALSRGLRSAAPAMSSATRSGLEPDGGDDSDPADPTDGDSIRPTATRIWMHPRPLTALRQARTGRGTPLRVSAQPGSGGLSSRSTAGLLNV